jgi:hypothetical protein
VSDNVRERLALDAFYGEHKLCGGLWFYCHECGDGVSRRSRREEEEPPALTRLDILLWAFALGVVVGKFVIR